MMQKRFASREVQMRAVSTEFFEHRQNQRGGHFGQLVIGRVFLGEHETRRAAQIATACDFEIRHEHGYVENGQHRQTAMNGLQFLNALVNMPSQSRTAPMRERFKATSQQGRGAFKRWQKRSFAKGTTHGWKTAGSGIATRLQIKRRKKRASLVCR
jgi:hypothetical protein